MCVFYAGVPVALRQRAFQICSPIFRGIAWAIKMNSGILPHPLTLILKISLKEHIPVLTKKKETEQQRQKNLHEISHFRGRRRTSPWHLCAELSSHPRQLHSLENGIFWAGCAEEQLVPGIAVEDSLVWSGFYLYGRKKSVVLQELPVQTEHTHAYLKLWVGNTSWFRWAVVQVLNFKCVLQLLIEVSGTEH